MRVYQYLNIVAFAKPLSIRNFSDASSIILYVSCSLLSSPLLLLHTYISMLWQLHPKKWHTFRPSVKRCNSGTLASTLLACSLSHSDTYTCTRKSTLLCTYLSQIRHIRVTVYVVFHRRVAIRRRKLDSSKVGPGIFLVCEPSPHFDVLILTHNIALLPESVQTPT